jgi:3D (Asp-Asp-Asp) domain-containing protein
MTQLITQATTPHEMPVVLAPEVVEVVEAPAPEWHTFEATAYVALCDTGCTGITRTGIDVRNTTTHKGKRVIAVDPSVIPLDTTVDIRLADGTTIEATAQDTGGGVKNFHIDILVDSLEEAKEFGRQKVLVKEVD